MLFLAISSCLTVWFLSFDGSIACIIVWPVSLTFFYHVSDKTLVISKYGASGDHLACTNLAYNKAISDGVDVLDCPVQMSKDGTPFCLNSIDLIESTTVAQSSFSKFAMTIPEIKSGIGIFAFNLTWNDIKSLTRKSDSSVVVSYSIRSIVLLHFCICMELIQTCQSLIIIWLNCNFGSPSFSHPWFWSPERLLTNNYDY